MHTRAYCSVYSSPELMKRRSERVVTATRQMLQYNTNQLIILSIYRHRHSTNQFVSYIEHVGNECIESTYIYVLLVITATTND